MTKSFITLFSKRYLCFSLSIFVTLLDAPSALCETPLQDPQCETLSNEKYSADPELGCTDCLMPQKTACYMHKAINTKDARYCERFLGTSGQTHCVERVAVAAKDYTLCVKFILPDRYNIERNDCIIWYAQKAKDPEVCRKFFKPGRGSLLNECLPPQEPWKSKEN